MKNKDNIFIFKASHKNSLITALWDEKHFFNTTGKPVDLNDFLSQASTALYQSFLHQLDHNEFAFCKDIILHKDEDDLNFYMFGILKDRNYFVFALQNPKLFFAVYDDFMQIINEQGRLLRESQKQLIKTELVQAREERNPVLADYMQLNNKLANMQRELALKNIELANKEKRFRDLVNFNPEAQVLLSPEGKVLFRNPASNRLGEIPSSIIEAISDLKTQETKEIRIEADHTHIFVECRSVPLEWEGNQAFLVSLIDISERKEIDQIKEDVQRITQHDLISPLNSIINIPQILLEDDSISESSQELLGYVSSAGLRMTSMVRMSLDLFKMEVGSYHFSPEPVDVIAIFRDIMFDIGNRQDIASVDIQILIEGKPIDQSAQIYILAKPILMYSLLSNLILNAVEHSDFNDTVVVNIDHGDLVTIEINNTGMVNKEIQDTFFEKYSTSGKKKGTGLGTYSAKLITETLGGQIGMRTSHQSGTTITVSLPPITPFISQNIGDVLNQKINGPTETAQVHPHSISTPMKAIYEDLRVHAFSARQKTHEAVRQYEPGTEERIFLEHILDDLNQFNYKAATIRFKKRYKELIDNG